ncbi:hypothetical protein PCASD_03308 [Puccinia coronata f. sp. avenae]|uniref:Uncharacterized protein n=1 Tax=Puccinia coronata f. sp. avenae TaxID=200324 RepID=A0A2N5VE20_9BASI|nr:hypothetical protein PCASD_03308 [Puccinia coronata f. sp. avenae]
MATLHPPRVSAIRWQVSAQASRCGCLRFWENPAGIRILVAHICFLSWDQRGQLVGRQLGQIVSAQTVSREQQSGLEDCQQRSELADCQPRPTVSRDHWSQLADCELGPMVSRDQRSQLTDCQPGQTVSAGQSVSQDLWSLFRLARGQLSWKTSQAGPVGHSWQT